jgi:hypothetical protein
MTAIKDRNLRAVIENGEAVSLHAARLSTALSRVRKIVQTIDSDNTLPDAQQLLKKIFDAEESLRSVMSQHEARLLDLWKDSAVAE